MIGPKWGCPGGMGVEVGGGAVNVFVEAGVTDGDKVSVAVGAAGTDVGGYAAGVPNRSTEQLITNRRTTTAKRPANRRWAGSLASICIPPITFFLVIS